jgi:hypothetical protein
MPVLIYLATRHQREEAKMMVDWTILSPTYLTAVAAWAGAVVTVLAVGPARSIENGEER